MNLFLDTTGSYLVLQQVFLVLIKAKPLMGSLASLTAILNSVVIELFQNLKPQRSNVLF